MSAITYAQLALDWKPESKNNRQFQLITATVIIVMLLLGVAVSLVNVPEQKRQVRVNVPERISRFLLDKAKPKPAPEIKQKPKPKPKPKPKKIEKPKVTKQIKKDKAKKPLTKVEKKARERASNSGLLALGEELADLMDTSDVSEMIGVSVKAGSGASKAASNNTKALLIADASKGSGGINVSEYATVIAGRSKLSQREITQVKQALLSPNALTGTQSASKKSKTKTKNKPRTAGVRAEEGITIVFDQHKSQLYTIYNRARRKNPDLKGKIVLEITVAPSGKVTKIKVVSNQLNDSKLETRLVNRIKQFNFGAQLVEEITVTYPIEFLPS